MILPVHSIYWPTWLQRIMLQDYFYDEWVSLIGLRSTLNLPMALMGLHTRLFVSAETYKVYISFTLFIHVTALWYIHWCTVCASILIQGWHRNTETSIPSGWVATLLQKESTQKHTSVKNENYFLEVKRFCFSARSNQLSPNIILKALLGTKTN